MALVGVVVFVFLQNWRAVLIPMIAVPVAIVGTFTVMAAVGFSLNNISLFGLVLSTASSADSAIVVVENVEPLAEPGYSSCDAPGKAMDEVAADRRRGCCASAALCRAFISGITGRFFRQFAATIAVSTVFSAFNSLTLSPALAALLLHRKDEDGQDKSRGTCHSSSCCLYRSFVGSLDCSIVRLARPRPVMAGPSADCCASASWFYLPTQACSF